MAIDEITFAYTCDDGEQNGDEEGVDCGGSETTGHHFVAFMSARHYIN